MISAAVVTEGRKVVGIITQNDIFEAFIDLLGYYEEGSRYVIQITEDKPGVLADLTGLFFDETAQITNLAVYRKDAQTDVVIRARGVAPEVMKKLLSDHGYQVISVLTRCDQ